MHSRLSHALPFCLAASLAAPLAAQVGLRDALPEGTILYIGAPDLDRSLAEMKEMPLVRMWEEPEVRDFFADALQMAEGHWDELLSQAKKAHDAGQLPFNPDDLLELRVHGVAVALTSLGIAMKGDEPIPHVGLVAQLDFGNTAKSWQQVIGFGLQMIEGQSMGMLTRKETMVGEAKLTTLVPPETNMSLNFGFVGTGLVFGTDHDEVKRVIENLGAGKKVLSMSPTFKRTFENLDGSGAELETFIQPRAVFDFGFKALEIASEKAPGFPAALDVEGIRRAMDALGLHSIQAIGSTSSYRPRGGDDDAAMCVNKTFLLAPAESRKGMFAASNEDLDMSFLRWVPKDVASFSAKTFDLGAMWNGLVDAMRAYDEEQSKHWLGMLSTYEQQFGVSVKEDLIGSLGNEFIMWSMPTAAMLMGSPEVTLLLEVKDPEKLVSTLETLFKMSDGMVELDKSNRRGTELYTIQINYDPTGGSGMNPLEMMSPTFSFKDGYLVAGLTGGDVRRAFKRMEREDDPADDIRSSSEFKTYLAQLPKKGVVSMGFQDWKADFESIYQMLTGAAAFIPMNEDIPVDLSLLPDVATLTQHLFGSVAWATVDGSGFHAFGQGPWGPETLVLICGGVASIGGVVAAKEKGW